MRLVISRQFVRFNSYGVSERVKLLIDKSISFTSIRGLEAFSFAKKHDFVLPAER